MIPALDTVTERALACAPGCGDVRVIAIDGRAGSGKSTWGALLAERLNCPLVQMEDLYPGWDGLAAGVDILRTQVLEPLAAGQPAHVPRWDWATGTWSNTRTFEPPPLLVVEGVGSGASSVNHFLSMLVWLECDADTRKARALTRPHDGAAFAAQWPAWAAQEDALLARDHTPVRADLVINTAAGTAERAQVAIGGVAHE